MRAKNNCKRPIRIGRGVLRPGADGDFAEHLLLQPRPQRLRAAGKLVFPYRGEKKEEEKVPKKAELNKVVLPEAPPVDKLEDLKHIGEERAKILNEFGISSFEQVVEQGEDLHKILEIAKAQAREVVKDAKARLKNG